MTIKRKYSSPEISIQRIDQDINLIMMSPMPGSPTEEFSSAPSSSPPQPQPSTLKSESPFGGTSPDYENM